MSYGGPTKASIAAREREAKAAAREADIARVRELEAALVSVHAASFPEATRPIVPPIEDVDPSPIRAELAKAAGIPRLLEATGGGETAPVVPPAEPVDRYELMREHRKRARAGIPFWRLREQIEAAGLADLEAEEGPRKRRPNGGRMHERSSRLASTSGGRSSAPRARA